MGYLLAYGSLIHPNETDRHAFKATSRVPVRVFGFERIFNQKMTYRKGEGEKSAVLNVVKKEDRWINGVLLGGFEDRYHAEIDKRESGYDRIKIPSQNIVTYDNTKIEDDAYVYLGAKGKQDDSLLPITDYLELCLDGAKSFGDDFFRDFLVTTWTRGEIRLDKYIENQI